MTYEEFKRELFRNVSLQESGHGRRIQLLEKGEVEKESARMRMEDRGLFFPHHEEGMYGTRGKMVKEDYLCVQWDRRNPLSRKSWNIHSLYERYKQEGWQGILPELTEGLGIVYYSDADGQSETDSYERSSRQFILRPLNYMLNREELSDCIYWRFGEIALVLYAQLGDIGKDYVTMKIRRFMTEKWRVTPEKMLTDALLNSYAKMPPRIFLAGDIRFSYGWKDGVFMPGESGEKAVIIPEDEEEGLRGYRLTTTKRKNGAIAIFYPGVQARLGEILKGDYLVGFTSVHEAVIHPANLKNPNKMKASIRHINTVFDEQDMLTNSVYRYCRKRGKLLEI